MNLANKITIIRILLVPFFIISVLYYDNKGLELLRYLALGIFSASILTDAIDGYIARTRRQRTELGTFLDPIADKLLLVSAFVVLSMADRFPVVPIWVPVVVISRDVIILLGLAIIHMLTGQVKIVPSLLGKATTCFQMVTIIFVLMKAPYPRPVWTAIWALVSFFTVTSMVGYIIRESGRLNGKSKLQR